MLRVNQLIGFGSGKMVVSEYALAYKTATAQSITGTPAAVTFNSEASDKILSHSTSSDTSRFTVGAVFNGRYARFSASVDLSATATATGTALANRGGSSFPGAGASTGASAGDTTVGFFGGISQVSTGQYFEVYASSNATGPEAKAGNATWGQLEYLPVDFQGCLLTKAATQALSASVTTVVAFGSGSEVYDEGGWFDTGSPNLLTVPADTSLIRLTGQVQSASVSGQFVLTAQADVGSGFAAFNGGFAIDTELTGVMYVNGTTGPIAVSPGHKFQISIFGPAQTLPVADRTFMQIEALPSDLKYCRARLSSDFALSAGVTTPVEWDTEDADVGGWFSAPNDEIIVPGGVSRVRMIANLRGASVTDQFVVTFAVNGSTVPGTSGYDNDTSGGDFLNAKSAILEVSPGDVLTCRAFSTTARNITGGADSWFSVEDAPVERFVITPPAGAFPVVEARSSGRDASAVTTHPITMPSGIQVGDLILVHFANGGSSGAQTVSVASGTGWSIMDQDVFDTSGVSAVFHKIADGSDALSIGTTVSARCGYVVLRISGAGTVTGAGAASTSASPNPPSHSPVGGSKKYLWVASVYSRGPANYTADPTNYDPLTQSGNVGSTPNVGTSERQLEAASEDPGAFTTGGLDTYYVRTLAIAPA